jgi:hypothetical protein
MRRAAFLILPLLCAPAAAQQQQRPPQQPTEAARAAERMARIERRLEEAEAAQARAATVLRQRLALTGAALNLQAAVMTARPWSREFDAVVALAGTTGIELPMRDLLALHAPRGLPTAAELRERFNAAVPQLLRVPGGGGVPDRLKETWRSLAGGAGAAERPGAEGNEAALLGMAEHLRRGDLAAALSDGEALDPAAQRALANWTRVLGARIAVEQAVRELVFRALDPG